MKAHQPHTRRLRGFTLIETMVAVAVSGVLLSVATPSLHSVMDTMRIDGAATQLAADLQFARYAAVTRNEPVRMSFHADASGGSCYVIHTGATALCPCGTSGPAQCTAEAQQLKTVNLSAADRISVQANVSSLLFDPLHGTSTPAGTLRIVGAQGRTVQHVVNILGRVRSCSPQAAVSGYRAC